MATRFKVLTGGCSDELENALNLWVESMEKAHPTTFRLGPVLPMPMDGEILYALARYDQADL